jgi:hypothetical protein
VYYKCVKFHKTPISGLGGVALTRYMDGLTDGRTDRMIPIYPPNFVCGGYNNHWLGNRGGSLSFLVGRISNVLVMEIDWTDVGSGGYILVSYAHSNTSLILKYMSTIF